jgi:hypothetical protein
MHRPSSYGVARFDGFAIAGSKLILFAAHGDPDFRMQRSISGVQRRSCDHHRGATETIVNLQAAAAKELH